MMSLGCTKCQLPAVVTLAGKQFVGQTVVSGDDLRVSWALHFWTRLMQDEKPSRCWGAMTLRDSAGKPREI